MLTEVLIETKDDGDALPIRKARDRLDQLVMILDTRPPRGLMFSLERIRPSIFPSATTLMTPRQVDHSLPEVCGCGGLVSQVHETSVELDERLLRDVFRDVVIACEKKGQLLERSYVSPVELLKSGVAAGGGRGDRLLVGHNL